MARIPETFNFSNIEDFKELTRTLQTMYTQLALAINGVNKESQTGTLETVKIPQVYVTDSAPTGTTEINRLFEQGDQWVDRSTAKVYYLTSRTNATTVTWTVVN